MVLTVTKTERQPRVAILHLEGILDATNHESLYKAARQVYSEGFHELLLDLGRLTFISSAGLAAIHQVALLFGANDPIRKENWGDHRWNTYRAADRDQYPSFQDHVKLVCPTKEVREVLEVIGFNSLFEVFTDVNLATESFRQVSPAMEVDIE